MSHGYKLAHPGRVALPGTPCVSLIVLFFCLSAPTQLLSPWYITICTHLLEVWKWEQKENTIRPIYVTYLQQCGIYATIAILTL